PDLLVRRHRALVVALGDGTLPAMIFEETTRRLDAVRGRYGIGEVPPLDAPDTSLRDVAHTVAAKTIRVSKDRFAPLPDTPETVVVDFQRFRHFELGDPFNLAAIVRDGLNGKLPHAT